MIDQSHGSKEKNKVLIRTDQSPSLFKDEIEQSDKGYTPQFQLTSNFAKADEKPNLLDELQNAMKNYSEDNEIITKESTLKENRVKPYKPDISL